METPDVIPATTKRRKEGKRRRERRQVEAAWRCIKLAALGEVLRGCVEAASELVGCTWQETLTRGTRSKGAMARVAAMHAAVVMGVPVAVVAKALKRDRWSVRSAMRYGRKGYEARDAELRRLFPQVVAVVLALNLDALAKRYPSC